MWRNSQNSEILRTLSLRSAFSALNSLIASKERMYLGRKHWSLATTLEARKKSTIVAIGNDCLLCTNVEPYCYQQIMPIQESLQF